MVGLFSVRKVVLRCFTSLSTVNLTWNTKNLVEGQKIYEEAKIEALFKEDSCQTHGEPALVLDVA